MKIIKSLTVSLFSFLLFIAILVFGILFTVNSTVLNPDFLIGRIDGVDTAEIMDEFVKVEGSADTAATIDNIKAVITKVEPLVKERLAVVINEEYDYLLGDKTSPDIRGALSKSFMNADFVNDLLNEISIPDIIETIQESGSGEGDTPEELIAAIKEVVSNLEPELKAEAADVTQPIFDYLLRKSQDIDLTETLRSTILDEDFIVSVIDNLDLSAIAQEFISSAIANQVPAEMEFLTESISDAVNDLEPTIKNQFKDAAGPFLDYILGESKTLSIYVSLDQVVAKLEEVLKQELLASPPPEYSSYSQSELEQLYDTMFAGQITAHMPATFEIDESIIGPEVVGNFAGAIADMEDSFTDIRASIDDIAENVEEPLREARKYVSYFQIAYTIFIIFIAVMVLGIILILRDVRQITRKIGVPLLTYGALEYAGIWAAKLLFDGKLPIKDIPAGLETWINDLINAIVWPLEIFSLALLVIGLILTVVSFVYKRGNNTA